MQKYRKHFLCVIDGFIVWITSHWTWFSHCHRSACRCSEDYKSVWIKIIMWGIKGTCLFVVTAWLFVCVCMCITFFFYYCCSAGSQYANVSWQTCLFFCCTQYSWIMTQLWGSKAPSLVDDLETHWRGYTKLSVWGTMFSVCPLTPLT